MSGKPKRPKAPQPPPRHQPKVTVLATRSQRGAEFRRVFVDGQEVTGVRSITTEMSDPRSAPVVKIEARWPFEWVDESRGVEP